MNSDSNTLMVNTWFPTLIGQSMIEDQAMLETLKAKALELQHTLPTNNTWVCDTFSTINTFNLFEDEKTKPAVDAVTAVVSKFTQIYDPKGLDLICTSAWLNVAEHKDYQEFHIHSGNHFSAVLYINTPENCGNIVFRSPLENMYQIPITEGNEYTYGTCTYDPLPGRVLCFPSSLYHMVKPNLSMEPRISAAFNFRVEK